MHIRLYQSTDHATTSLAADLLAKMLRRDNKMGDNKRGDNKTSDNKILVRCASRSSAKALSELLWRKDGFIPHGIKGEDTPQYQVIWLSYEEADGEDDNPIAADSLLLCDGLLPQLQEGGKDSGFTDIIIPFDSSPQLLQTMRDFWRDVRDKKFPVAEEISYWHRQGGKWQAVESGGTEKVGHANISE